MTRRKVVPALQEQERQLLKAMDEGGYTVEVIRRFQHEALPGES